MIDYKVSAMTNNYLLIINYEYQYILILIIHINIYIYCCYYLSLLHHSYNLLKDVMSHACMAS